MFLYLEFQVDKRSLTSYRGIDLPAPQIFPPTNFLSRKPFDYTTVSSKAYPISQRCNCKVNGRRRSSSATLTALHPPNTGSSRSLTSRKYRCRYPYRQTEADPSILRARWILFQHVHDSGPLNTQCSEVSHLENTDYCRQYVKDHSFARPTQRGNATSRSTYGFEIEDVHIEE